MAKGDVVKVHIGCVGVDSGQLMIIDPCYIDSNWEHNQPYQDERVYVNKKTGATYRFAHDFKFYNEIVDGKTPNQWIRDGEWESVKVDLDTSKLGYNTVCHMTINGPHGASIPYAAGHGGLAVAFRSGLGDGVYDVYAHVMDCGDWGHRVSKVEIVMIEPDEI